MVWGDGEAPMRLSTLAMASPDLLGAGVGARSAAGGDRGSRVLHHLGDVDDPGHVDPVGQRRRRGEDGLPGGSSATRARLRAGSSSENTSSSSRVGVSAGSRHDQLVDPDAQGQGQAALLALGGVGPGLAPVQGQQEIVAVGPHRVDAPPEVVGAVRHQARRAAPRSSSGRTAG